MTGNAFRDWVLVILGNIFIIVLAVRAVGYYAKQEWGSLIGHVVAGILVAGVVYLPDQVIGILKGAWERFSGS